MQSRGAKTDSIGAALDDIVRLLSKTAGRDKVIKFWQYLGLLIAYTKLEQGPKTKDLENPKWLNVYNTLRTVRKVLRFLRTMEHSRKIMAIIKDFRKNPKQEGIDKMIGVASMLSSLGTILFYMFDHRVFLAEAGITSPIPLKRNFTLSFMFWFAECFFAIVKDLLIFSKIKKQTSTKGAFDKKKVESDVSGLSLDIIKNIGDCLIALSRARGSMLSQQKIGILGVVTSVIGMHQMINQ